MAKEKRLIDANALHQSIAFVEIDTVVDRLLITEMIHSSPTVDAVEVVRCKDCKHWNKDALACDTLPWANSAEHANWYADDFCSYGERKDND